MDHIRKLRMTGNDSYIITIPMEFVRRLGWDAGMYITFDLAPDGRSVCMARVPQGAPVPADAPPQ
ncbi:MAG: AbrB/MazE/SpoVT family DNA-binding domain-containing protein, partial [Nitrosopumilaceae archaeon]|nr:AbrB/MazE/SpoVT family DNA-binding domain-containing protein [Nitrosopumilaceae archaeon]